MFAQRVSIALTTDGSGNASGTSTEVVTGRIASVIYTKHGTNPFSNGVDFTVTVESTGESVWAENDVNASAVRAPRQATHSTAGVAALYAAGGAAVNDHIVVANDRISVAVAQGGAAKQGTITVVIV
jgi:hypothetical protein